MAMPLLVPRRPCPSWERQLGDSFISQFDRGCYPYPLPSTCWFRRHRPPCDGASPPTGLYPVKILSVGKASLARPAEHGRHAISALHQERERGVDTAAWSLHMLKPSPPGCVQVPEPVCWAVHGFFRKNRSVLRVLIPLRSLLQTSVTQFEVCLKRTCELEGANRDACLSASGARNFPR